VLRIKGAAISQSLTKPKKFNTSLVFIWVSPFAPIKSSQDENTNALK